MSKAKKQKRGFMKKQVLNYLKRTSKKSLTYGDLAEHFSTAPMAIGQCLSALGMMGTNL